jgi:hypothetical protein
MMVGRAYDEAERVQRTAAHLRLPEDQVRAALRYAADFADEINAALEDNDSSDFASLQRLVPRAQRFVVSQADVTGET